MPLKRGKRHLLRREDLRITSSPGHFLTVFTSCFCRSFFNRKKPLDRGLSHPTTEGQHPLPARGCAPSTAESGPWGHKKAPLRPCPPSSRSRRTWRARCPRLSPHPPPLPSRGRRLLTHRRRPSHRAHRLHGVAAGDLRLGGRLGGGRADPPTAEPSSEAGGRPPSSQKRRPRRRELPQRRPGGKGERLLLRRTGGVWGKCGNEKGNFEVCASISKGWIFFSSCVWGKPIGLVFLYYSSWKSGDKITIYSIQVWLEHAHWNVSVVLGKPQLTLRASCSSPHDSLLRGSLVRHQRDQNTSFR